MFINITSPYSACAFVIVTTLAVSACLKKRKKTDLTTEDIAKRVFTDDIRDTTALVHYPEFSANPGKFRVEWMPPRNFLNQVDPHFKCEYSDQNMSRLTTGMKLLMNGDKSTPKFAPLVMDPTEKRWFNKTVCCCFKKIYPILKHDGRHRALTAERLGIPRVPVAIRIPTGRI